MKRPCLGVSRKIRTFVPVFLAIVFSAAGAVAGDGVWEKWSSESFTLAPRESFQFHVEFDEIQVRSWKLVVDGGDMNCDLSVLRVKGEALLYYETDEQRHEVLVPWGRGEEVIVVVTNRNRKGNFVVDLLGPPRDQIHAAYSYHVNRALEAFGSGQRLKAEAECEAAISEDGSDAVAKVLLAGFLRNRSFYSRAESLVREALIGDLPPDMRGLAEDLKMELAELRAPLPEEVVQGVARVEKLLADGKGESALTVCDDLLNGDLVLDSPSKSRLQMLRGQALDQLDRNFEAVDAFTKALQLTRQRDSEATIYFHMGRLYLKMENLQQAQGAYTMALKYGLPSGLDVQAREDLKKIEKRLAQ
ncbi:MAG: hypothetical protein ABFS42_02870 [Candidatus Krumholzibacteriota bacterium]